METTIILGFAVIVLALCLAALAISNLTRRNRRNPYREAWAAQLALVAAIDGALEKQKLATEAVSRLADEREKMIDTLNQYVAALEARLAYFNRCPILSPTIHQIAVTSPTAAAPNPIARLRQRSRSETSIPT